MFFTKKKIHPIALVAKTDIGKERNTNEDNVDSLVINPQSFRTELDCKVLVVADGMGGHEMGEVASEIAAKKFIETVKENILHLSNGTENINFEEILTQAVEVANREVWKISEQNPGHVGTTLVGAIIVGNQIFIANVGDSRAYLVSPKKSIHQITKDHSAVQEMFDAKIITKKQMRNHPRRNIITKALGLEKDVTPDIFHEDLKKNNILLLCSDGLYNMIDDREIANTFNGDINKSADDLISLANKHGGVDNISVAIAG
jgi:protein phosphatase